MVDETGPTPSEEPAAPEAVAESAVQETQAALGGLAAQIEVTSGDIAQREALQDELATSFDDLRRTSIETTISALDGVETVNDLRELPVDQLIDLEAKHEGVLLYAFTDFARGGDALDLEHFTAFYKSPQPGAKLRVSFRGNKGAEAQIGAGDIFPPSVRRVTVYPGGDEGKARTSKRRLGLKGRNDFGTGFFDKDGYIPIYSQDVVVIGGARNPEMGVKPRFESRFRAKVEDGVPEDTEAPLGELDYEAYEKSEHGRRDQRFIDRWPTSRRRPGTSFAAEDEQELMRQIEASGVGADLLRAVEELEAKAKREPGRPAKHCFDWISMVYERAGAKRGRKIYDSLNDYTGIDCGEHHAPPEVLAKLQTGDWLFINNRNKFDDKGNHSVIFLGWKDQANQIAYTASYGGGRKKPGKEVRDFKDQPVVRIRKPAVA